MSKLMVVCLCILACFYVAGCAGLEATPSQLAVQAPPQKAYAQERAKLMEAAEKALLNMGYQIKNKADGLVVAEKETNIRKSGEIGAMMGFALLGARESKLAYPEKERLEASVSIQKGGEVSPNFVRKSFDNRGGMLVNRPAPEEAQAFYRQMEALLPSAMPKN